MHYGISAELDDNARRLLFELFKWMESQDGLRIDRDKYDETHSHVDAPEQPKKKTVRRTRRTAITRTQRVTDLDEPLPVADTERYEPVRHNELEDFLL